MNDSLEVNTHEIVTPTTAPITGAGW